MWPISASSVSENSSLIDLVLGQGGQGQRRDELRAGLGQDRPHADPGLAQQAGQLQRLVGRHPAADDQKNRLPSTVMPLTPRSTPTSILLLHMPMPRVKRQP
jgi:hypothetical protein